MPGICSTLVASESPSRGCLLSKGTEMRRGLHAIWGLSLPLWGRKARQRPADSVFWMVYESSVTPGLNLCLNLVA